MTQLCGQDQAVLSVRVGQSDTTKSRIGFDAYVPGACLWISNGALFCIAIQIGTTIVLAFRWLAVVTHVQVRIASSSRNSKG